MIVKQFRLQVKWLEEKLHKVTSERDYYRTQFENLKHAAAMAATRTSNANLLNGSGEFVGHQGQLDLSLSGVAAAAAQAAQHEEYKRDATNGYQNNNDLKLGTLR